jgi:hypothetical protein
MSKSLEGFVFRSALIRLENDPDFEDPVGLAWSGVSVVAGPVVRVDGKPLARIYVAAVRSSVRIREGKTTIPTRARTTAEGALEAVAHVTAVDRATAFTISSPVAYVGFRPLRPDRLAELDGVAVSGPFLHPVPGPSGAEGILDQLDASLLADRFDGLALLAEAINAKTALGRYLQLMRLFERAFRLAPGALAAPLAAFLRRSPYRFSKGEVRAWSNARALSLHADRRDEFNLDADVRPFVDRMTLAGYEVLANKASWRDPSAVRRSAWTPRWGTSGPGVDMFLTAGSPLKMSMQLLDRYRAYPLILNGSHEQLNGLLPRAAWMSGDVEGCELLIIGNDEIAHHVVSRVQES